MPLRPATFAPYPAPDKRAAARERYLRALEEARKAKEAYADTLSDGEEAKKETETEQLDHPSPPAATTTTTESNSTLEAHKRREEPMMVDPVDPLPATRADSPLAQTEPLLRQPSPAIPAATPVSESAPTLAPPTAAAAASKAGCDGSHKACHLTSWLRASMGIPSMFAAFPKTASPVDPHPQRIETTMPAPIPGPPPTTTPAAAPAPSDNDCAHRRRAALNVATLSEQQPPADFKSTSSFARTDSSASSSSRLDTRQRRPDDGFRGVTTDDHRSQPSPSSSSSSHHGFPPAATATTASSSSARDGWLPRSGGGGGGGDLYRRPEFPPTQLAPLPPPRRSRSDSTSDDGSGSGSGSGSGAGAGTGTVLPPLRETSGWRYGQPSQFTDKYVWDERRPPSSPSSGERQQQQQQQLPPMSRGSSSSSRSHLPLLAAAAATVEANSMYRGSDTAPCLKRHERDWDSDRDQEDSRRSRDRPWESGCLVAKGVDGHKREVGGEHLFSAAYPSSSRRSDGSSPRRIPREPAHGLADLPRAFAALTSGSPLAATAAAPTSIKYPLDFMRPGRGESVMPEPVQSDERVMPSPIDNDDDDDDDDDVPMREAGRAGRAGRSRSRSRSPASTLTASSSVPPLRVAPAAAAAGRSGKGKEPATTTTTPKLPGLAGLAPLPPLARALPQLPLPAPKPRPPSPTPQRIPLFVCEESAGASACVAAAEEPDAASADALSEIGRLSTSLESLKHAFTFPSADQLDFGPAVWPAGFSRTTPTSTEAGEGPRVRLPVTARNLTVHAYEHALHKLLGRLDGVGAARVRGVRDARKRVVGNVREELARLDDHVQSAARAWLARNPDVSLP